jgi:hypothetical protein
MTPAGIIAEGAAALGLELAAPTAPLLARYSELVIKWNRGANLTGADLCGVDLRATSLTAAVLTQVHHDHLTSWPSWVTPPE